MFSVKLLYSKVCACLLLIQLLLTNFAAGQKEEPVLTISGYVDIYYLYNFQRPLNNTQPPFIYNFNRSNEVNLNLGFVKASYKKARVRANFGLMSGTYTQANLAAEPEVLRHVYEANAGIKLSTKTNLWLDAGIMPSHIGFESAISKDCYNLTRSILAENSPYYEAGIRVHYTNKNEKWFLSLLLLNGWQRIRRVNGNTTPAFGTQITFKPSSAVTLNSSTFIGSDKADSTRQWRYFHNFYGIFQLSQRLAIITGFDIGAEQVSKGSSQTNVWYSPVVISKFSLSDKVAIAVRAEHYNDKYGVIISKQTSTGLQSFGYSANIDYSIAKSAVWRIEARTLKSKDRIFENRNRTFKASSTWLTTSVAVTF